MLTTRIRQKDNMSETQSQKSPPKPKPENSNYYYPENEINLVDLIKPLWQQKSLIFAITCLAVIIAVILVLTATPKYRIYAQLKPGIFRWDNNNKPIPYLNTPDLKALLGSGIFNIYAAEKGITAGRITLKTANDRRGNQVTVYFFWPDKKEGRQLLAGFIKYLNDPDRYGGKEKMSALQIQRQTMEKSINDLLEDIKILNSTQQKEQLNIAQKKAELSLVDQEKDHLQRKIERIKADTRLTAKKIKLQEERIKVARETQAGYEKNRREIDENTSRIITLRDQLLQNPPDDSLQLLLLSSTIQQNIAYLGTLNQKIETARKEAISSRSNQASLIKEQEEARLKIADLQDQIDHEIPKEKADIQKEITELQLTIANDIPSKISKIQQQIDQLRDRINVISLIDVVEYPQASIKPEKPKKKRVVALAGIMGLFFAIFTAYSRYFWRLHKKELLS